MIENLRATYREEANELLTQLESTLLELESAPADLELIGQAFRQMHTIKGSGAMFGFDRIAGFTHEVESVWDRVRSGGQVVTPALITITLSARDHIRTLLEQEFGGAEVDEREGDRLLNDFRRLSGNSDLQTIEPLAENRNDAGQLTHCRIQFRPAEDILLSGTRPELLLKGLRDLGPCEIVANTQRIPPLAEFDTDLCYISWDILLTTDRGEDAIRDVFVFVEDTSELKIEPLQWEMDDSTRPKIGEILLARGDISTTDLEESLQKQKRLGEHLIEAGRVHPDAVRAALVEQDHLTRQAKESSKSQTVASIRVTAEKLDSLVNAVGELVTVQARLSQLVAATDDTQFASVAEDLERLTERLRTDTMGMRMLPIGATFSRFRRLVRDLSAELGKQVELTTDGAETELDKNVIEQLNDPLVHIIRNCIDHGIESPGVRTELGKSAVGQIRLSAVHSGTHVLITVSDDGAGLDRDVILAKAIEKGLVAPGVELSDNDVYRLLFQPGFSTAREVTEISGRGVGLDVVERSISALRGSVEVRTHKGEGTTFVLRLPLTLAIIDGLLVVVGDQYFVMPVSSILECVELTREEQARHGRRAVVVRNEMIPYVQLRDHFSVNSERPRISQVILAETAEGKFGFVVDRVIGDHQTVIKSLGRVFRDVVGISGATILGDGAVALILDLDKLAGEAIALAAA